MFDSNWNLDERIRVHDIPLSRFSGFARRNQARGAEELLARGIRMTRESTPWVAEAKKLKALLDTHGRTHLEVRAEPGGSLVAHSRARDGTEEQHVRLTPAAGGARWSISLRGDGGGWREKAQAASLEEAVDVLASGQPTRRG